STPWLRPPRSPPPQESSQPPRRLAPPADRAQPPWTPSCAPCPPSPPIAVYTLTFPAGVPDVFSSRPSRPPCRAGAPHTASPWHLLLLESFGARPPPIGRCPVSSPVVGSPPRR